MKKVLVAFAVVALFAACNDNTTSADGTKVDSPKVEVKVDSPKVEVKIDSPKVEVKMDSPKVEMKKDSAAKK